MVLWQVKQLLAPEIRQERNTILQCIRHIVNSNFFGIEGSSSETETPSETRDLDGVEDEDKQAISSETETRNETTDLNGVEVVEEKTSDEDKQTISSETEAPNETTDLDVVEEKTSDERKQAIF